jgi:hypothetical protein
MRREKCETGKDGKFQGGKSGDTENLPVPNRNVPKSEDCEHKGAKVEGEET